MTRTYKECPICKKQFLNLGSHMPSCYEKSEGRDTPPFPMEQQTQTPVYQTQKPTIMDDLEKEMAQQLRILNYQKMMQDIRNPPKPYAEQNSEIDTFTKFLTLQRTMEENILDNLPEEIAEGGTFEEKAALKLIETFAARRNQTPPKPEGNDPPEKKEDNTMTMPTAQELNDAKDKIRKGETSLEEMKIQVRVAYPSMSFTDEQLETEFNKIKNS